MKNQAFAFLLFSLLLLFSISSCDNGPGQNMKLASMSIDYIGNAAANNNNPVLNLANEYQQLKEDAAIRFEGYSNMIQSLKEKVKTEERVKCSKLQQQLNGLAERITSLKKNLTNHNPQSFIKWDSFKRNFTDQMKDFDNSIAEITLVTCNSVLGSTP